MTWDKAHNKRVTLNLARRSNAAKEIPGLVAAIDALDTAGWDMYKLPQGDVELIYTSFDDTMEERVKAEFEADPNFLIDHGHNYSTCQLCGQYPIRFEFRINQVEGGEPVNCGIDCIVNHQLHVKGAETADAARRVLEAAIRKQLRKVMLAKWHEVTGFAQDQFQTVAAALLKARNFSESNEDWSVRNARFRQARYFMHELRILERFYVRTGWLGTEKKWDVWTNAIKFARQWGELTLPVPMGFAESIGKLPSETKWEEPAANPTDAPPQPAADAEQEPAKEAAPTKPTKQLELFEAVATNLVFGEQQ